MKALKMTVEVLWCLLHVQMVYWSSDWWKDTTVIFRRQPAMKGWAKWSQTWSWDPWGGGGTLDVILTAWHWTNHLTSLCFSFLISEMETFCLPHRVVGWEGGTKKKKKWWMWKGLILETLSHGPSPAQGWLVWLALCFKNIELACL